MTRYHFHAGDGSIFRDADGEDLPSLEAAQSVALDVLTEMLPTHRQELWEHKRFAVYVKDGDGRLVVTLTTIATLDPSDRPDVPPDA